MKCVGNMDPKRHLDMLYSTVGRGRMYLDGEDREKAFGCEWAGTQ